MRNKIRLALFWATSFTSCRTYQTSIHITNCIKFKSCLVAITSVSRCIQLLITLRCCCFSKWLIKNHCEFKNTYRNGVVVALALGYMRLWIFISSTQYFTIQYADLQAALNCICFSTFIWNIFTSLFTFSDCRQPVNAYSASLFSENVKMHFETHISLIHCV